MPPTQADPKHTNRLAGETSPYLLQHAHNPVDWYPWGEEAFEAARTRGVPIFLSIGYSTCYWCHVMERESFENEAIAKLMNDNFVCIKVDREERPDVDEIYMAATVMMTGRGGWPMSCFLEPEQLRPFWCGTYFPPEPRPNLGNIPSFPQVLEGISGAWQNQQPSIVEHAEQIAGAVREQLAQRRESVPVGPAQVERAVSTLLSTFDRAQGGFGSAPKFPQPVFLELLLAARTNADDATRMAIDEAVRTTLDRMAVGGMYDQIGGGFHRYSVDATWTVPHFEKMLYDQGQLASLYARAGETYDDDFYTRIARETCEYVVREMSSDQGGLLSAQDAEVDHREGLNYLWTPDQMRAVLAEDDAEFAIAAFGLDGGPNFQDPHHPEDPPRNVLRLSDRPERIAERFGVSPAAFHERLQTVSLVLYEARAKRKQPHTDDKILSGWNGLMIAGLANTGRVAQDPSLIEAANRAAAFVLGPLSNDEGELMRSWREGQSKTLGFLEDSAFVIRGLLALHEATGNSQHLDEAIRLLKQAGEAFGDAGGGYFDTRAGQADLFVRTRSSHDGAVPSGASVMLNNLITLHMVTSEAAYLDAALASLRSLSPAIHENAIGTSNATRGLLRLLGLDAAQDHPETFALASDQPAQNAVDPSSPPDPAFSPVEVFAETDRVQVGKDHPAEIQLMIRVADGFHILASNPGPGGEDLIPTRVHVVGGTGINVYADYPQGEKYGENGELRVHHDRLELTVAVERAGEWSGRPLIAVTYQACTDTECMMPRTVELDVAIDRID